MLQGIDHIAIAVESLEGALPLYRDRLGFDFEGTEVVESEKVRVAILRKGPHRVELLEPTGEASPIARFLERRGPGLHHVALLVEGLDDLLTDLASAGVRLIDAHKKPGADGRNIAFVHPKGTGGVLLELSEIAEEDPEEPSEPSG